MKKTAFLASLLMAFYFNVSAQDQSDSAYIDLGRIKLRKDFTQNISIKGTDLEKFPAASLSEAINVWVQGTYTTNGSLAYVIDGNLVNDVNAYSIYDIDEISFIQNAAVQLSGAPQQKQLIVITTKNNGSGKTGISAAGQFYFVNKNIEDNNGKKDTTSGSGLYHQYYISARGAVKNLNYGGSASYLRDIMPSTKFSGLETNTPTHFDRLGLNGYLNAKLGTWNHVHALVSYTPQLFAFEQHGTTASTWGSGNYHDRFKGKQSLWTASLRVKSILAKGLSNSLSASYKHLGKNQDDLNEGSFLYNGSNLPSTGLRTGSYHNKSHSLLLSDRLAFIKKTNNWEFEPSVYVAFQQYKSKNTFEISNLQNGNFPARNYGTFSDWNRFFVVTPSVSLRYKNGFYLQGGVQELFRKKENEGYPYVTASLDIVRIFKPEAATSLMIFNSFGKSNYSTENDFTLDGLSYTSVFSYPFARPINYIPSVYNIRNNETTTYSYFQSGANLGFSRNRVQISYTFEKRNFPAQQQIPGYNGNYMITLMGVKSNSHRVALIAKVVETDKVKWTTSFHVNNIRNQAVNSYYEGFINLLGDIRPGHRSWTGGWVNRVNICNLSFGSDVLYLLDEKRQVAPNKFEDINSFLLQNFFVGYRLNGTKNHPFEIYASSRNPVQSKKSILTDNRRFYGAGFKMEL